MFFEQVLSNNTNLVNENTKDNVMTAINKIKNAISNKKNDIEIVNEEGMALLNKLAWLLVIMSNLFIIA